MIGRNRVLPPLTCNATGEIDGNVDTRIDHYTGIYHIYLEFLK